MTDMDWVKAAKRYSDSRKPGFVARAHSNRPRTLDSFLGSGDAYAATLLLEAARTQICLGYMIGSMSRLKTSVILSHRGLEKQVSGRRDTFNESEPEIERQVLSVPEALELLGAFPDAGNLLVKHVPGQADTRDEAHMIDCIYRVLDRISAEAP